MNKKFVYWKFVESLYLPSKFSFKAFLKYFIELGVSIIYDDRLPV